MTDEENYILFLQSTNTPLSSEKILPEKISTDLAIIEEIDFNELYNKWYDMQVNHHKQIHINNPKMQAIAIGALKDKEDFIETCKKDTKFLTFVYSLFY